MNLRLILIIPAIVFSTFLLLASGRRVQDSQGDSVSLNDQNLIEAGLHETSDPRDPRDAKHHVLARAGVLDAVEWVPTGGLYEVRGGPVGTLCLVGVARLVHGF